MCAFLQIGVSTKNAKQTVLTAIVINAKQTVLIAIIINV